MAAQKSFERKHFFIDRKLQGRYMISFLVPMILMLVFMMVTVYFAANSVVSTSTTIIRKDVRNIKNGVFLDVENPTINHYKDVVDKTDDYLRDFAAGKEYRKAVLSSLVVVLGIGLFVVIIEIAMMTIFFSHKLAGPVYRFEMSMHKILNGDYTDKIHLRKGDEMQNLAGLINEVNERTSELLKNIKDAKTDEDREKIFKKLKI